MSEKVYMKGYKAFKPGLICNPTGKKQFQFAENTVFEEPEANICHNGFHFCKNPLAVLDYYPLVDDNGNVSEFAEVEALDEVHTNDNEKYCTKKIRIGGKISFPALVQASVNFDFEKIIKETANKTNDEDSAKIGSSGYYAKIGSSGDYAQIGSSGYYAKIGSSGDSAQIGSSGDSAQIGSSGEDCVICCAGHGSKVKAKKGSWITLSEWRYDKEKNRTVPVCVKTEFVDGKKIKSDIWYQLVNGEFKEVEK